MGIREHGVDHVVVARNVIGPHQDRVGLAFLGDKIVVHQIAHLALFRAGLRSEDLAHVGLIVHRVANGHLKGGGLAHQEVDIRHGAHRLHRHVVILENGGLDLGLLHLPGALRQGEMGELHIGLPALEHVVGAQARDETDGPGGHLGPQLAAGGVFFGGARQDILPLVGIVGHLHGRKGDRPLAGAPQSLDQFEFLAE